VISIDKHVLLHHYTDLKTLTNNHIV